MIDECARQDLELVCLDEDAALERFEPVPLGDGDAGLGVSSWGQGGDLSTWSGPAVAGIAFATRAAELATLTAATEGRAGPAAVRELLALQASDWAFMVSRGLAVPYAHERFDGHRAALDRALGGRTRGERRRTARVGSQRRSFGPARALSRHRPSCIDPSDDPDATPINGPAVPGVPSARYGLGRAIVLCG